MSAGTFVKSKYEYGLDPTQIFRIRVQPETLLASAGGTTNDEPAAALNRSLYVKVGASRRQYGIRARGLYLTLAAGATPPPGYATLSKTFIPALTSAFYAAALTAGVVSYLGTTWSVEGRPETQK